MKGKIISGIYVDESAFRIEDIIEFCQEALRQGVATHTHFSDGMMNFITVKNPKLLDKKIADDAETPKITFE